jgi:hypothetical protein
VKVKKYYADLSYIWIDENGIIGQPYPEGVEGGDAANWNGQYNFFSDDPSKIDFVETFEVAFGGYVRHPHKHPILNRFGSYYKNAYSGVISRDQMTGILLGVIDSGNKAALIRLILNWSLKLFIFSNNTVHNGIEPSRYRFNLIKFFYNPKQEPYYKIPDLTLTDIWAMALRGFGLFSLLFFPILFFCDIHLLISTLIANKSEKDDVISYLGRLALARKKAPTPIGWLAVKILNKEHLKSRLALYWKGWRDNPGMYDLHCRAVDELK